MARAQPKGAGCIAGTIKDASNDSTLANVNVVIVGSGRGAASERTGRFRIDNLPAGRYDLRFQSVGYATHVRSAVPVRANDTTWLAVGLTPKVLKMQEVTVEAVRSSNRDTRALTSLRTLTPRAAKNMAGGVEDVFRALQSLPGVLGNNEFDTRLYVRGGRPDQNLTLMDGINIYDPYRVFGLISMFNPLTVTEVKLIPGGFSAKYGDRLSSVVEITNRNGTIKSPLQGSLNTSITNANLVFEGKIPGTTAGSWLISARRTYYDLLLRHLSDAGTFPSFADVQGRICLPLGKSATIIGTFLLARERTDLLSIDRDQANGQTTNTESPDTLDFLDSQSQSIFGATASVLLNSHWLSETTVSHYRNTSFTDFGLSFFAYDLSFSALADMHTQETALKQHFRFTSDYGQIWEMGFSLHTLQAENLWRFRTTDPAYLLAPALRYTQEAPVTFKASAFVENTLQVTPRFLVAPGLRVDHSSVIDKSVISPRLAFALQAGDATTIKLSGGTYYQFPNYETLQGEGFRVDLSRVKSLHIDPELAIHALAGVEHRFGSDWTIRVEGYYKDLRDLLLPQKADTTWSVVVKTSLHGGSLLEVKKQKTRYFTFEPGNTGKGYARGLEIYLQRPPDDRQNWAGWLSYAYAKVQGTEENLIFALRYDQRHTVTCVLDYRLSRALQLDLRWLVGSGFPYTDYQYSLMIADDRNGNGVVDRYEDKNGNGLLDPGEDRNGNNGLDFVNPATGTPDETVGFVPDDARTVWYGAHLPWHHRLDARLTYFCKFWTAEWQFYLDVINLYNQKNIQSYEYSRDFSDKKPIYGIPFVPTIGFSVAF